DASTRRERIWAPFVKSKPRARCTRRTNLMLTISTSERSPELGTGWFSWFGTFWKLPDAHALTHQGLDAYLFLRYLRVACIITLFSMAVTWPILFPVNATGHNGQTQLEVLSYSNINPDTEGSRYFAHALVAWVVYGFV